MLFIQPKNNINFSAEIKSLKLNSLTPLKMFLLILLETQTCQWKIYASNSKNINLFYATVKQFFEYHKAQFL